jgi:hypothetical protein
VGRDLSLDPTAPGAFQLASTGSNGELGDSPDGSGSGQLSADGRYAVRKPSVELHDSEPDGDLPR